jgi:lipopolysaccharide transport system ATP-binding protein
MCLGMTKEEAIAKSESIIEFSELKDVIDQPFKTYSSGMQARLTFSTAISMDPDILIIDEALAAGDGFFIPKCFKRIKEICDSGATVFFVSHSTELVKRLCTRAIHFDHGRIVEDGEAQQICSSYEALMLKTAGELNTIKKDVQGVKIASSDVEITDIVLSGGGERRLSFFQGDSLVIKIEFLSRVPLSNPGVWVRFTRSDGVVATSWLSHEPIHFDSGTFIPGENTVQVEIDSLLLGDGTYSIAVALFPYKDFIDSSFYNDPLAMWDGVIYLSVRRRGRVLSTVFDQPMKLIK